MAPPGSRAVIYEDPTTRHSWESHGTDAWYCGPALDHYRCMIFYVPSTRSYRISGSFDLFPQHCLIPELTIDQHAEVVFTELTDTIGQLPKKSKKRMLQKLAQALAQFATSMDPPSTTQRVGVTYVSPPVTTSTNPTDRRVLQATTRTHQRVTRNNTPGGVSIIEPTSDSDKPK